MLDRTLERAEGLRPLAVLAAVPEEERAVGRAGDRHRAAVRRPDAVSQRRAVLKRALGLMTRRARHLAVRAEARVEEQRLSQCRRRGVIGEAVRCIGTELLEM